MKITRIQTFLMHAGAPLSATGTKEGAAASVATATGLPLGDTRHWLFVKVHTDAGIVGLGEGSGWPLVVEAAVRDLAPTLIGENAADIERLWQKMFLAMAGHGQTGVVGAGAITAIEMALWDIKGKALGTPVWNLLGGKVRDRIRVYAHASSPEQAKACVALGYRAIKTGGVIDPVGKIAAIRDAVGQDVDLMVDLHGPPGLQTKDALLIGRALEPYRLLFWEEPVPAENIDGLRRLRDAVAIPLASGERLATIFAFRDLLREPVVDVIQPDTGRCGGISQLRKIGAMAEAEHVGVAPHSGSLGPVAEMAAIHVLATLPNALIMEQFAVDWPGRFRVTPGAVRPENGHLIVPDTPGLGIELVEEEVASNPPTRNSGIRATAKSNSYEEGTYAEHALVQTRFRRARTLT
jgi:galactonate dehydratase